VLQFENWSLYTDVLHWSKIIIIRKKNVTLEEIDLIIICLIQFNSLLRN